MIQAATKEQLTELVKICNERGSILVFDAAYAPFIRSEGKISFCFESFANEDEESKF